MLPRAIVLGTQPDNDVVSGFRQAVVWRFAVLQVVLVAIPAWFTIAVLVFNVPWSIKILSGSILVVTGISPAMGLLAVAALAPMASLITTGLRVEPFRIGEAIVLAFLVGWMLRALDDRPGPRVAGAIGWLFALTIVASVAVEAWLLTRYPGQLADTFRVMFFEYFQIADGIGFIDGARLLEGLALAVATVTLFRQRPNLELAAPIALMVPCVPAVIASIMVWWRTGAYRVSGHVGDPHAAASYFDMLICLALGMAVRARGRERAWWFAAAVVNGIGVWMSESRTAIAAVMIALAAAIGWYMTARLKPVARTLVLSVLLMAALAVAVSRAQRDNFFGLSYRRQFNATSLRMVKARPLFGIGVGRYYQTSPLFLSPEVAWYYGFENAHNNFLQIAAELGLIGFGLFLAWIATALLTAVRAIGRDPRNPRLLGVTSGVAAFAATWLGSHPLLVAEVAAPFWIQFGLMWALAGSTLFDERPSVAVRPWARAAAIAIAVCVVVAAALSARRGPVDPSASRDVDGLYEWETADDGTRFRWTERFASIIVPVDVMRIEIPVRSYPFSRVPRDIGVDVMIGGVLQTHANIGTEWRVIQLPLPDAFPPTRFKRIDLRVDRTWQPALYVAGSRDMRSVGVQVGDWTTFRGRR